ncbi:MAG: carboxypeptidase-like regulatory domain-containing protein, partial [Edaphobacter sp.]
MSLCVGRAQIGAALKRNFRACLLMCIAAVGTARAVAQSSVDGAIGGFVADAGGSALVGATVQVESVADGTTVRATTVGRGEFLVGHLSAGEYRVVVEYALFAPLTLQQVVVEVGGVTTVEARMLVGGVTTSVSVTAGSEAHTAVSVDDLSSAAVGGVVTPDEIERLPVNGRRWQSFALMMPEVNADPEGDGLLSFRGMASTENSSRIDGGDDDQSFGSVPRGTGAVSGAEAEDAAEMGTSSRVS